MAKPLSKVPDSNAPDGTVTVPLSVTVLPSGRPRAAPMSSRSRW